ncbi:MAG: ATP-binding protein [Firmicutes bacterium HGW-Firmicutes-1]|jgi:fluoroquinolone transport system ATP-binding protein|nr:MAG: ATP-binding protein [Firmicutes bacterium HGW-Firmicutes-1]
MITVQGLDFTYPKSNKEAIKKIDFDIKKGEIFGFLGPSGAGKTTTQRLIIGLLRGYEGNVEVLGKERRCWGKDFYENIGVAFDFPNLYIKLTAEENLKLIRSYYKNKTDNVQQLLDKVGLLSDKDKKVEGYSKGMKMRLNFIRAIMHEPELMFFDEPTSGLDPVNAKIIKDMIVSLKASGKTIFLTTHNMTVAEQLCDRVAFIVDGKISVIDEPKKLMLKHGKHNLKLEYADAGKLIESHFELQNIGQNNDFFEIMKNKEIKTIHSQEATLEDVFIKLTGRELL